MITHSIRLTDKQLDTLSQMYLSMGTISIASVAIPSLLDSFKPMMVVLGIALTTLFWTIALLLRK